MFFFIVIIILFVIIFMYRDLTFKKDYSIDFSKFPVFENLVNL